MLRAIIGAVLMVALLISAAPQEAASQASIQCIGGPNVPGVPGVFCVNGASATNPLTAAAGGLGPKVLPSPTAPGTTGFFDGDSIMLGSTGSTTCSLTYGVTVTTPTGNCMADLIALHFGVRELGYPVLGTCVVLTATDANGLCNKPSATVGSMISRYQADASHISPGMLVFFMMGTNDAFSWSNGNSLVNIATFKANLTTILAAFATASGSPLNVIVSEIPHMPTAFAFYEDQIDAAIDDVVYAGGYSLAVNASTIQQCANINPTTDSCTFDATHPDVAGYAAMAAGFYAATFANSVSAGNAARQALTIDFPLNSSTNVILGGRATAYLSVGTAAANNTCGGFSGCAALTTGSANTSIGSFACNGVVSSNNNTCFGAQAGQTWSGQGNTAFGFSACSAFATLNFVTCLGSQSAAGANLDSSEIVIGASRTGLGSNSIAMQTGNAPGFFSGTGVPAFSAPNSSLFLRFDGGTTVHWYMNTSGASTTGTTWTAIALP